VRRRLGLPLLVAVAVGAACTDGIRDPSDPALAEPAPDSFRVALETSRGRVEMVMRRAWSPAAVDRVYHLARMNFWAGAHLYRVNPRYAQFGYTGRPEIDSVWVEAGLPDEPAVGSNVRGSVSFARGGPGTRSTILFVNREDNTNLDHLDWNGVLGFPPVGSVVAGMEVVDALHGEYADDPMQWEDSIRSVGNAFLDRRYPGLDSIMSVQIVEDWR